MLWWWMVYCPVVKVDVSTLDSSLDRGVCRRRFVMVHAEVGASVGVGGLDKSCTGHIYHLLLSGKYGAKFCFLMRECY